MGPMVDRLSYVLCLHKLRKYLFGKEISQKVTYLFCDELDIVLKELRSRVRQATKDVVKSEV